MHPTQQNNTSILTKLLKNSIIQEATLNSKVRKLGIQQTYILYPLNHKYTKYIVTENKEVSHSTEVTDSMQTDSLKRMYVLFLFPWLYAELNNNIQYSPIYTHKVLLSYFSSLAS